MAWRRGAGWPPAWRVALTEFNNDDEPASSMSGALSTPAACPSAKQVHPQAFRPAASVGTPGCKAQV